MRQVHLSAALGVLPFNYDLRTLGEMSLYRDGCPRVHQWPQRRALPSPLSPLICPLPARAMEHPALLSQRSQMPQAQRQPLPGTTASGAKPWGRGAF